MKHVDFVFFDAGGGHRAAATALNALIDQQGLPWRIEMVNLQEILDEMDIFRKFTGIRMQDVYNLILKKGWTLGAPSMVVVMHWLIRLYHPKQVRLLEAFWCKRKPDLVVSVIPNFGRALYQSLKNVHPKTKLVTILTDLADYPPHFWMEAGQDQTYICGTPKARRQALDLGYTADQAIEVAGMILHPRFYESPEFGRHEQRRKLGLNPVVPTGLILFGGQGSPAIPAIVKRLEKAAVKAQFIVICGKNEALRKRLAARSWGMPIVIEGFTSEVPHYMRLSDFFIGKPGPGSISEAIQMGLPVIVESNAWTLPQERYNAGWIREHRAGIVLDSFGEIGAAVKKLLDGNTLAELQANARKVPIRAVFEIPPILERLMKEN